MLVFEDGMGMGVEMGMGMGMGRIMHAGYCHCWWEWIG